MDCTPVIFRTYASRVGTLNRNEAGTSICAIIRGVEGAAAVTGYDVLLCDSNEDPVIEQKHLSTLASRRVDGVLLACCLNSSARAAVVRRHFPVVFVDRLPETQMHGTVCTDNFQASYVATRHLTDLGHQRIGVLAGHSGLSPHRERLEGFRKVMQELNLPVRDEYLSYGDVQIGSGYEAAKFMLGLDEPPTAIIASNNPLTLGLVKAMNELKVECPRRLSVIGFGDFAGNESFSPPITTVRHPEYEAGKRSLEMLLHMIANPAEAMENVLLPTELLIRNSIAPPGG